MPEYTFSNLIWIVPACLLSYNLFYKRQLRASEFVAFALAIILFSAVGFGLDIAFGNSFFTFPNRQMICGVYWHNIPIEEYIFYLSGFITILLIYLQTKKRLKKEQTQTSRSKGAIISISLTFLSWAGFIWYHHANGGNSSYGTFLLFYAYIPFLILYICNWRKTCLPSVGWTLVIVLAISIVWEVGLALPRGYWGYNPSQMCGLWVPGTDNLPIEAVTVWFTSVMIVFKYEAIHKLLQRVSSSLR